MTKRSGAHSDEPQRQPWMKFYGADWRANIELRACSYAARGLWMEMLCLMHEASPRGFLLLNSKQITMPQLAVLAGGSLPDTQKAFNELEGAAVFSRDDDGTIYSRRMRRDVERAARDKANGSGGGNPSLVGKATGGLTPTPTQNITQRVNPPDKPKPNPTVNGEVKAHKTRARATSVLRNYPSQETDHLGELGEHLPQASTRDRTHVLDPGWDDDAPFGLGDAA